MPRVFVDGPSRFLPCDLPGLRRRSPLDDGAVRRRNGALTRRSSRSERGFAFAVAAAATVVPVAALLSRGVVAPMGLFVIWLPRVFHIEAFGDPHGPFPLISLVPFALARAIAALLESRLRSRYRGWDGGRFAGSADAA